MPDENTPGHLLYREIFQETSSGDFGIQVAHGGPLFRCHTSVLSRTGGFIGKVRQFGKGLSRSVDQNHLCSTKAYFKARGYDRLLDDLSCVAFSQPLKQSTLQDSVCVMKSQAHREDPLKPGYTTAHFVGGETGAVKRFNPFFLAERYEVDCDCERMAELLRFCYQGEMSFFQDKPVTDQDRKALTNKMLAITFDAEKYSVDALYDRLLNWFGLECFIQVGERNFCDAFYHLQHFEAQCTEEYSRQALVSTVTGQMLATRPEFRAVTRDPRWSSLPVDFVEGTLSYDGMPIGSETEVLNLIERWNVNADKKRSISFASLHALGRTTRPGNPSSLGFPIRVGRATAAPWLTYQSSRGFGSCSPAAVKENVESRGTT